MPDYSYPNLTAHTLVVDTNSTYLANTGHTPVVAPLSSPTLGLMMFLSSFQYTSGYIDPMYADAANKAGQAAYITSGAQAIQDKFVQDETRSGTGFAHSIGVTDTEMGIAGLTYKTLRKRELDLNGPKILEVKTTLQGTQTGGSLGLRYEW